MESAVPSSSSSKSLDDGTQTSSSSPSLSFEDRNQSSLALGLMIYQTSGDVWTVTTLRQGALTSVELVKLHMLAAGSSEKAPLAQRIAAFLAYKKLQGELRVHNSVSDFINAPASYRG